MSKTEMFVPGHRQGERLPMGTHCHDRKYRLCTRSFRSSGGLKSFDGSLKILEGRKEQSVEVGLQQGKGFYQWW